MLLPCFYGCGSCQDCEEHCMECVRDDSFNLARKGIEHILLQHGLGVATAKAFSWHPSVLREFHFGRIPQIWQEAIPELLTDSFVGICRGVILSLLAV